MEVEYSAKTFNSADQAASFHNMEVYNMNLHPLKTSNSKNLSTIHNSRQMLSLFSSPESQQ